MPNIEFIYEQSCPNVVDARAQLRLALKQAGLPERWQEWEYSDPRSPAYARRYGSPTVLVDGRDVAGEPEADATSGNAGAEASSCRVYTHATGRNRGVPDAALIHAALEYSLNNTTSPAATGRAQLASLLPVVGAALLPKLSCPACWPAYAALLGALGIGFVDYTPYLFPLTLVFLIATLVMLAWRPRRGFAPLALGLISAAVMLIGKFGFDSDAATYAGVALLVGASAWNAWPKQSRTDCARCKPSTGILE